MKTVALLLLLLVVLHAAFGGYVEEEEVKDTAGGKPYFICIPISTVPKYCHMFPNYFIFYHYKFKF